MANMIEIVGLKKSYGDVMALSGLNFEVPKGQIVGFLGPNGAGKSTTMKILTGFLPYNVGSVKVSGLEVAKAGVETRKLIGYLPENNPQYEDMMVYEYLSFIADMRNLKDRKKEQIEKAVERCGLKRVVHKDIEELSKGYRQRVGLAQAILHEPELLILDEPTSGLDPNQIIEIRNLIKDLGKETTILMSTHILHEAQSTCERILIINNGLLVADDTPEELLSSGEINLEVAYDFNVELALERFKKIVGIKNIFYHPENKAIKLAYENSDPRLEIFKVAVELDLSVLELKREKTSLEETFRRLTFTR